MNAKSSLPWLLFKIHFEFSDKVTCEQQQQQQQQQQRLDLDTRGKMCVISFYIVTTSHSERVNKFVNLRQR